MNLRLKSLVGAILMLGAAAGVTSAMTNVTHLRINFTSGECSHYLLSDAPSIAFTDDDMVITVGETATNVAKSTVDGFTFTDGQDGIAQAKVVDTTFALSGDCLTVNGEKLSGVTITGVNGRQVASASAAQSVTIDLSGLASGVYVVTANGSESIKIIKK